MPGIHLLAAAPWESDLLAAGELRSRAHVWSLVRGVEVAALDTVLDLGGRRLCLVDGAEPVVVAGSWERHGVCGYSLTGELLWQDRTRSNIQHVTALSAGRVAVGYARGPARVLVAASGQELITLRGVTEIIPLAPDTSLLVSGSSVRLADADLEPATNRVLLPPSAPMVHGAAGGPGRLALAGMTGTVWFLDHAGVRHAKFDIPGGHAPFVAHDAASGHWWVVTRLDRVGDVRFELVNLTSDAEVLDRSLLPHVDDAVWLDEGRVLVFTNGDGVFALDGSTGVTRLLIEPT